MRIDSHLIRVRRAQPSLQRTLWGAVTFVFWLLYVYLWLPALTFVLWVFGLYGAYGELYARSDRIDPFLLLVLPLVALTAATVLILWAEYNRARFTGRERRAEHAIVPIEDIARDLCAGPGVQTVLATARISVLHMDERACPQAVTVIPVPAPSGPAETGAAVRSPAPAVDPT